MKRSSSSFHKTFRTVQVRRLSLILAALTVMGLTACSNGLSKSYSNTYQLPWSDNAGNYSLQNVQMSSFDDPQGLKGRYGVVLVHPRDASDGKLTDTSAAGHFLRAGGVEVAADVLSLEAAAVYAHLERFHQLDTWTGGASAIHWPVTVGIDVNTTAGTLNNALYDGHRDAVIVVPYQDGRVPIVVNGGILAHEHFHAIFQSLVVAHLPDQGDLAPQVGISSGEAIANADQMMNPQDEWGDSLSQSRMAADVARLVRSLDANITAPAASSTAKSSSPPPLQPKDGIALPTGDFAVVPVAMYNQFLVRGLNEGFADFYGWVYSGDPTFIENSLSPKDVHFRRMNVSSRHVPSADVWSSMLRSAGDPSKLVSSEGRVAESYMLGTYCSAFLRELAIRLSDPSTVVAKSGHATTDGWAPASAVNQNSASPSAIIHKTQSATPSDLPVNSPSDARTLGGISETQVQMRAVVAKALIAALPMVMESIRDQYQNQYIEPTVFVQALFSQLPKVNASACELAERFGNLRRHPAAPASAGSASATGASASSGAGVIGADSGAPTGSGQNFLGLGLFNGPDSQMPAACAPFSEDASKN